MAARAAEFLPVGDDAGAWSFRVIASDGIRWFLKVRRGPVDPAAVLVPRFRRDHGLEPVVAAVPTADGERDPWRPLDGFTLLAYPWVEGVVAMKRRLTGRQWAGRGRFMAALHRAARLGRAVAAARPELVLCHADLHLANLLVDAEGRLWVVDWDGLQLTPRERDLLFATGPNGRGSWRATGPSPWTGRPWPTTAGSGWCRSWPTTVVASSTTGSGTTPGGTPWRSSGGCSRPVTWSRWPGGPARA
jgi:hypothetical protein